MDDLCSALSELEQICFTEGWTEEMLAETLGNPLTVLAVERRGDTVAGYAVGRVAADEGELFRIAVLPDFRRMRIAESLLGELHGKMRSRGAAKCFLEVRSRNDPAIALYEKQGYRKIALRKNYYGDDDAVIYEVGL
ncbi:MAG: ribosomal protein S18-alanine N-acetyltransferase [Oscillospiraceae bacterium]|nr:ribosomal protein S18-alanine N-acetyltransferase [Oscillospiraceae bacterium]